MIAVTACSEPPPPLAGIDLPPASLPDEVSQSGWSVAFVHEFGEDFWGEGEHVYQLALECPPIMGEPLATPPIFFEVERLALPIDHVFLRLGGISDSRLGPLNVSAFNPRQATTAVVSIIGVTESAAKAAFDDCVGQVTWDLSGSGELVPLEPFKP